jgi:surface antigen
MKRKIVPTTLILIVIATVILLLFKEKNAEQQSLRFGDIVDSLNHVYVFYNGDVGTVRGRHISSDGYNLGLKYQCVEFVKRYYYQRLKHKMPDSYGNAKDLFDPSLSDGEYNKRRALLQYRNPGSTKPDTSDLIVMDATAFNSYGHVAIVSAVTENELEIIQQNPGSSSPSRVKFDLEFKKGEYYIDNGRILGWLRKPAHTN